MLPSLKIRNYRNISDLRINNLKRVNLIVGKNNTGKTSLLEAISIFAMKSESSWLTQLLRERGEYYRPNIETRNFLESNIKSFSSLFTDRKVGYNIENAFSFEVFDSLNESKQTSFSLQLVKYIDEKIPQTSGTSIKRTILTDNEIKNNLDVHFGVEIKVNDKSLIIPLENDLQSRYFSLGIEFDNLELIRTNNITKEANGRLWDKITLTDKEKFVFEALSIIEPNIERIAFIDEPARVRTAVAKLKNVINVVPIKSMGDGINRVLTIILALINADNGFLLIDELETGLHYTVQDQIWNIIFKISERLNVQVFATTHSRDCIDGFESVLEKYKNDGKLIRLENIGNKIREIEYNAEDLKIATENNIETR